MFFLCPADIVHDITFWATNVGGNLVKRWICLVGICYTVPLTVVSTPEFTQPTLFSPNLARYTPPSLMSSGFSNELALGGIL
jgi:hypothetical protein